jgi:hypothetical protein
MGNGILLNREWILLRSTSYGGTGYEWTRKGLSFVTVRGRKAQVLRRPSRNEPRTDPLSPRNKLKSPAYARQAANGVFIRVH